MTWSVQFFNESLGVTARYHVDAAGPAAAVSVAEQAVLAAHPPARKRPKRTLFRLAQRRGPHDSAWILYRIRRIPDPATAMGVEVGP
jgi:hypothetical protein